MRRAAAACTSAWNSGAPAPRGSSSGCQSTPRQNARDGSSTPSTMPSGARAVTTRPSPTSAEALVMVRVDLRRPPRRGSRAACRLGLDVVPPERAELRAVGRQVESLADVLDQVAAVRDVQQLQAAADAEHRQAARDRAARSSASSTRRARGARAAARRCPVRLGAVVRGPDVLAADQDQTVDHSPASPRVLGALGRRREQERHAARRAHALDVALRDHARGSRSQCLQLACLPVGADADPRPAHRRSKERRSSQSVTADSNASLLEARGIQVVVDDLVAERLARERGARQQPRASCRLRGHVRPSRARTRSRPGRLELAARDRCPRAPSR